MSNVLGELFSEIAESIRGGLGDIDAMKPNAFPKRIDEIVEALKSSGSGDSGGEGDSGESGTVGGGVAIPARVETGTFHTTDSGIGRINIKHTLGVIPDFVVVYVNRMSDSGADLETSWMIAQWGVKRELYNHYLKGSTINTDFAPTHTGGIDKSIDDPTVDLFSSRIYCPDESTIRVGTDMADNGGQFGVNTQYAWIAISGLGGGVGGSSADVRYVTFMNHDGTVEYGKKAVAYGDDCADPIARGIFSKPTRESDVQYSYTFYGWATEPNGAADADWYKAITENKTVYANFASTVRYYTITYYDSNGTTVLKTESLAYGVMPSYTASKEGYGFGGWTPTLAPVTGNASYVAKWIEKVTFANGSWADIVRIANSGEAQNYFALGDQKTLTYTDPEGNQKTSTVQIVGFDHDDLADGSGKASMSILAVTADFAWHINADYYKSYSAGWEGCDLRSELNAGVFNSFPETLRDGIKTVKKTSRIYVNGTDTTGLCESNDKVWLPSFTELGGTGTSSNAGYAAGDGIKYSKITVGNIVVNANSYAVSSSGNIIPDTTNNSIATRSGSYKNQYRTIVYQTGNKYFFNMAASYYNSIVFGFCI